jgi:(E)-4-hydroxy-3-methyl-but-2-enyl pyrophosphate reductase
VDGRGILQSGARRVYAGRVKVLVAESAGFCWGVRRAVDKARELVRTSRGAVYTDGPLIHNRQMMGQLREEGVLETSDPASVGESVLLIRAHGVPPQRREELKRLPACVVDATCPDVARIQGLIRRHARQGRHIVIFGDGGHAEVVGLLGFAEGRGHVVEHAADVAQLPALDAVCLVAQSTQLPQAYAEVAAAVRRRFPQAEVLDTICASTRNRQRDVQELATQVDAFVVVGDVHSANTLRLVELARSLKPTFHIETRADLDESALRAFGTVGLTAGASTPRFVIDEVRAALESL